MMAGKKTIAFSDAHLETSLEGRETVDAMAVQIRQWQRDGVRRIFILGDLFDFWFEYRHVVFSGYFPVLRAFADARDADVELHLVCGNHDFWAGRFLETELGFHVHRDPVVMDWNGRRVLLAHGDGINPKDRLYRLYKRVARSRLAIALFRQLHPDLAMGLARGVSHGSRHMTMVEDPSRGSEAKALRAHAQSVLAAGKADVVLMGHAHAAIREECPAPGGTGLYINCGDWRRHRSYVMWDGAEFILTNGA
ncbi:MAG TPA: UDP-2,3-diacylglucosamine diphosphatase [Candidatus Hydrogenedentes bacterium]|nr:UDP-2,3-diacylglucosamine diphosphatase [Candidatus Hydrogenedentota bacterium]HOV73883.1 UDP-2,3-diacylglucosamine diphosphatase [Candidatus Hydrogenedentota bacterium]HPC14895.1 UDP-2,3-diacylglucosamine diphosphatase [Candidatus Hydrogenedentota bacterium]HRT18759.1 UDP-2,3-diacylglucosamine diphosphatase [Candidatus Hydrogenedentota bacterium]HRT63779.1 UDP-2,3-diacylglucosamine diphosphatase [Candidatus Hydrogenedentota bacterium]